jgi:uncharacterized membrane-anchored protein
MRIAFARALAVLGIAVSCSLSAAEPAPVDATAAAWQAASAAMQRGPSDVPLLDQAVLHLPEHYGFVPRKESVAVMSAMGNRVGDDFLGLVFPLAEDQDWFASLDYTDEGYIKDDEARDWNANELLDNLKEGTKQGNEFRKKQGFDPIEVTGWIEPPAYDAAMHRLVWSVGSKSEGQPASESDGVNYNTYVLGREGYISLDLITSADKVEAEKPIAKQLLAAVDFNQGRRYADFNSSTDKVAAYGLAALVGGVALKKLGLFAVGAAFFAKFAKLIFLAVAGVCVPLYKKFFKKG